MVLDKLVGYKISPLLWKEFKNYHLSAGRVQSPVVRIISEREDEISKFTSDSFFKVDSNIVLDPKELKSKKPKTIQCTSEENIKDQTIIENIMKSCINSTINIVVTSLKKNNTKRNPAPPYTTSTMQQDASAKLGMSPDICMKNAQKLYEAGLITYMRTDAVFIAEEAMKSIENYIVNKWGDNYAEKRAFKNKSASAQEAHECCRPTDINKSYVIDIDNITPQQNKLYQMIWRRTVACQMAPADVEIRTAKFDFKTDEKSNIFVGKHEKIVFDGYLAAYNFGKVKKDIQENDESNNESNDESDNEQQIENNSND
jgi:DNA topoisomerase-1